MLKKRKLKLKDLSRWVVMLAIASVSFSAREVHAYLPTGWTSARALGMGNAQTAIVRDGDAIFYNPAGLARVSGIHWTLLDPRASINNPQNLELATDMKFDDVEATLNKLYGKRVWAGVGGGKSAIWLPYFGVAAYQNSEVGIFTGARPNPRLELDTYFDYGGAVGFAADIVPSIFSIGATVRYINRTGAKQNVGPATLANLSSDDLRGQLERRGTGYAADFGALLRIPGPISPSVSFVYRDAGVTTFSHEEGVGAPASVPSEMIIGAGMIMDLPLVTITPAIDFRYVNWIGVHTGLNINAGVEVELPLLSLRGGVSQGYYTAGAGVDIGFLRADVATWAVELGAYPGQHPDRRYMGQVTIELGFDAPSLFSTGKGRAAGDSSRRGLKRRR